MIQKEDLRIGNLLNYECMLCKVSYIGDSIECNYFERLKNMVNGCIVSPSLLEGVPLTEDWLLRFGYKHVNTLHDGTKSFEGKPYCYFKDGRITISTATYHEIKWVHQLQNLIYALTGEELKI